MTTKPTSTEPIVETCRNPAVTRKRAMAGLQTPCYRCIAFKPETQSGCHFIEQGVQPTKTSPRRQEPAEQETLPWKS